MEKPAFPQPVEIIDLTLLANIPEGSVGEFSLPFGNMASGAAIVLPVTVARGVRPGPCLWVNGQVHGDELNGVIAALEFVRSLPLTELAGTVVVSATANPVALDARRKRNPWDDLDLDHCYPGHANGMMTERLAARLFPSVAASADVLISMHSTNSILDSDPFGVYKPPPTGSLVTEADQWRLMAQFGLHYLCVMPVHDRPGELPGHLAGGLDYQVILKGKPAVMIELGAGGRADPAHIAQGVEGLANVARLYSMLPGTPLPKAPRVRVTRYDHVTCDTGGLFRRLASPGSSLAAGEAFGEIRDLHGRVLERPSRTAAAHLIGVRRDPVVHTGDRVCFVASEWTDIET